MQLLKRLVLLLFLLFAALNCFVSWYHQNKEVNYAENRDLASWRSFRNKLVSDRNLVAYYSFQDENLQFGSLRNRRTLLPNTLSDFKSHNKKTIGRVVTSRWNGKQGIELDKEYLRLPITAVSEDCFTLAFWIRQNGLGTVKGGNFAAAASLITLGDGVRSGWRLDLLSPSNRVIFQLAKPEEQQEAGVCASLRVPPKTWTHIAISRTPDRIRIYVNGLLAGESEHNLLPTRLTPTTSLKIGYAGNGMSSSLFQIDELAIWSSEKKPHEILYHSQCLTCLDENFGKRFDNASVLFAKLAYPDALSLYEEILTCEELPSLIKAVIQFRCGEIHSILGNMPKAIEIYGLLLAHPTCPIPTKSHALHDMLFLKEKQSNPEDTDLTPFSVANSTLYGELSYASTNYTNAMIEYDFLIPLDESPFKSFSVH